MKSLNKEYIVMSGENYISEEKINIFQFVFCSDSYYYCCFDYGVLTYWDEIQPQQAKGWFLGMSFAFLY